MQNQGKQENLEIGDLKDLSGETQAVREIEVGSNAGSNEYEFWSELVQGVLLDIWAVAALNPLSTIKVM